MPSDVQFELATGETECQFRRMLRQNPLAGSINVLLTREPNAFHAAATSGDVYELMLAFQREPRRLLGGGARFEFDAFINGEISRIGYLGELRVEGGLRQRRRMLLSAYRAMRKRHDNGNVPFYITTIISDNTSTRRLLEAGLGDMPTYEPVETLVTLSIPTRRAAGIRVPRARVEACGANEIGDLAARLQTTGREFQFHPVWTVDVLRSGERCRGITSTDFLAVRGEDSEIKAACCLWDQRAFKQTIVAGYSGRLRRMRPLFNIAAPLLRQPGLPAPGQTIESAFVSHLSVDADDEQSLLALVREAARKAYSKGIDYIMVGLASRNPLSSVLERHFSCHRYESMIYLVYWEDGRDRASKIDGRIAHPEVAIL